MTFFNVDDNLQINDKWASVPRKVRYEALGFWTWAGAWCAHNLTDGHITTAWVEEQPSGTRLAQILVDAKIWRRVPSGYQWVNWAKYQPTREQELKRRKNNAERQARFRRNRSGEEGQDDLQLVT